jgi:hypothetical protein
MAENFLNNPPQFDGIENTISGAGITAPKTYGTVLKYGADGLTVTGVLIDSYSRGVKYANMEEIMNQDGIVSGIRMSDGRAEISVSGRVKSEAITIVKAGATFSINGETALITEVSMSAGSKEFVKVDIKAACYEGVSGITLTT